MNFQRVRQFFVEPSAADVALEFSSVALIGARVESARGRAELRAIVSEPLAEGAFVPALEDPGFVRKEEIRDATKRVLARIGAAPGVRTALVVPDIVARFRLFAQDEVKAEPRKREAIVAFRMQKLLPFPPADVRVISAWPKSSRDPVLAMGMSTAVLEAYEQVARAFGLDVGSVETSSMALLRGLSAEGDALLVRHDRTWLTLTLTRDGWPLSIRSFDGAVARSIDEVRREMASTSVFWKDRLGGKRLAGAWVHCSDAWFDGLSGAVSQVFASAVQRVQSPPRLMVSGVPQSVERSGAPALSLLVRI